MTNGKSVAQAGDGGGNALGELLLCLDNDSGNAWTEYEILRRKLVKFFECYRCHPAEDYADQVFDRIAKRPDLKEIRHIPSFALGVARNIYLEHLKHARRIESYDGVPDGGPVLADDHDYEANLIERLDEEPRLDCLRESLATLTADERQNLLEYYDDDRQKLSAKRRDLAAKLDITMEALRVRMNRARERLLSLVQDCLTKRRTGFCAHREDAASR